MGSTASLFQPVSRRASEGEEGKRRRASSRGDDDGALAPSALREVKRALTLLRIMHTPETLAQRERDLVFSHQSTLSLVHSRLSRSPASLTLCAGL